MGSILGRGTVLIVDNDVKRIDLIRNVISSLGYHTISENSARSALKRVLTRSVNVIIASVSQKDMSADVFLDTLRKTNLAAGVVLYGKNINARDAVSYMKKGTVDIILDVDNSRRLKEGVQRAFTFSSRFVEDRNLRQSAGEAREGPLLLYRSRIMDEIMKKVHRIARVKATVLITGESGTGKDVVAGLLHNLSGRTGPFITLNCAAIPDTLLEDELFGHEVGAFTGAERSRAGKFEAAGGGTLLLDEIGEIALPIQVKLLRVLEEDKVTRLGGNQPLQTDVRLISATNSDLNEKVKTKLFRQDLYYRLKVIELHIPPLRSRKQDIPLLAISFLRQAAEKHNLPRPSISKEALKKLSSFSWPGNVRQLKNLMESLVVISSDEIDLEDLPEDITGKPKNRTSITVELPQTLDQIEEKVISTTLDLVSGNRTKASELLGIGRRTLQRKLSEKKTEKT